MGLQSVRTNAGLEKTDPREPQDDGWNHVPGPTGFRGGEWTPLRRKETINRHPQTEGPAHPLEVEPHNLSPHHLSYGGQGRVW